MVYSLIKGLLNPRPSTNWTFLSYHMFITHFPQHQKKASLKGFSALWTDLGGKSVSGPRTQRREGVEPLFCFLSRFPSDSVTVCMDWVNQHVLTSSRKEMLDREQITNIFNTGQEKSISIFNNLIYHDIAGSLTQNVCLHACKQPCLDGLEHSNHSHKMKNQNLIQQLLF